MPRGRWSRPGSLVTTEVTSPWLVLRCVEGMGNIGARRLADRTGSAEAAVQSLRADERQRAERRAREVLDHARRGGSNVIVPGDDAWPSSLEALEDAPVVLFARGASALLNRASVAIVGTRAPTAYGVRLARRMALAMSQAGVTVVSGLARGIDAVAHETAAKGSGSTVAVLGTGADVCYPRQNRHLYERVVAAGVVVSEALPGASAHPGAFPRRNRIIAALADVTLVVEAGVRSGALITAQHAAALGRIVAAVPGPVDVDASAGSNGLLRDGAQVVTGVEDLLGLLDLTPRGRARPSRGVTAAPVTDARDADERSVLSALGHGPRHPDDLVAATGLSASRLAAAVATLSLDGLVTQDASGLIAGSTPG